MKVDLQIKDKVIDCLNIELFKSKNVIKQLIQSGNPNDFLKDDKKDLKYIKFFEKYNSPNVKQ